MGEYTGKLAKKLRSQQAAGTGGLLCAEYVSPNAIRIGGQTFSHNIHQNPDCSAQAGDSVLAAQIGTSFYVICKVV